MKKIYLTVFGVFYLTSFPALGLDVNGYTELNNAIAAKEALITIESDIITTGAINKITYDLNVVANGHNFLANGSFGGFEVASAVNVVIKNINMYEYNSTIFGALLNYGNTAIYQSGFSNGYSTQLGGAVRNEAGSLKIYSSNFNNNYLTNIVDENSGGGAIYNNAVLELYNLQILNSKINNQAINSGGAGLFNAAGGQANIQTSLFQNGMIESSVDYKKGAGIYNQGRIYIYNSGFLNNVLSGSGDNIVGAGIYNQNGLISMNNVLFMANVANYGSAIYNEASAIINIYNSSFENNTSQIAGGAIYNKGILSIIADDGIIRIYGNKAITNEDDAIYNIGELNLNAGSNLARSGSHSSTGFIDYRDDIVGDGSGSVNVNDSFKVDADANAATVEINTPTSGIVFMHGSIENNNLNIYNGVLSFAQGITQEHFSGDVFNKQGGHLWLDVDLSNGFIDTINANIVNGTPNLSFFRIISDASGAKALDVFTNVAPSSVSTASSYTNNYKYDISYSSTGELTFNPTSTLDGYDAARSASGNRSFTMSGDVNVPYISSEGVNPNTSGTFTIFGNLKDATKFTLNVNGSATSLSVDNSNVKYGDEVYEFIGAYGANLVQLGSGAIVNVADSVVRDFSRSFFGGAIGMNYGTLNVMNSIFYNNTSGSSNGGAISSATTVNIFYSTFLSNNTTARGGALSNGNMTMSVQQSVFQNNSANQGGAIATRGLVTIADSEFNNNKSVKEGGALYLYIQSGAEGKVVVDSTSFESNSSKTNGGAIYNDGTLTILNSSFKNNTATINGGALYNTATTYIVGNSTPVLFSGNAAGGVLNAIYNTGTLYINAGMLVPVTFDDAISGSGGTININEYVASMGYVVEGDVIFNNSVSDNTINLYNGTLVFGSTTIDSNVYFGSLSNDTNFNVNAGATISTVDNAIRQTNLGILKLSGDVYYGLDVDVKSGLGDTLTGTLASDSSGTILINNINVLNNTTPNDLTIDLKALSSGLFGSVALATDRVVTSGYKAQSYAGGILTLIKDTNLKEMVNKVGSNRVYEMLSDEAVASTLGDFGSTDLTVVGKGIVNNITASSGADGMIMTSGQTLTLINIGTISGFANSFINATDATINITGNTTLLSAIVGNANINIADTLTLDNTSISGNITGAGSIATANSVTFNNTTLGVDVSGFGSVTFIGTNTINGSFATSNAIINSGILNLNSDFVLNNSFDGGSLNFNSDKVFTINAGSITNITDFNMGGGTLKTSGDGVKEYNIGNATLTNTKLDLDMKIGPDGKISSDVFVGATNMSSAILNAVNFDSSLVTGNITGATGFIEIFKSGSNVSVSASPNNLSLTILSQNYTLDLKSKLNGLDYNLVSATNSLQTAIASIANPRQYIMNGAENAGNNSMSGSLSIIGGGNEIIDGTITMEVGSNLTLNNLTMGANIVGDVNTVVYVAGNVNYKSGATIANLAIDLSSNSKLTFASDASLNSNTNSIIFNGGSLSLANNDSNNISLASINLSSTSNMSIDVDLREEEMDTLNSANITGTADLNITYLNLISDAINDKTRINFTTSADLMDKVDYTGLNPIAYSSLYKYDVSYDKGDGYFTFTRQNGDAAFNSSSQIETVSNQTIYTASLDLGKNLLAAVDALGPLYNLSGGDADYKAEGAWVKTYGSNEDVGLGSLTVDNQTYAGILGVDFKPEIIKNGFVAKYSIYAAYLESKQQYDDVSIEQNGINFGGRAIYNKGRVFTGFVFNAGFNLIDANNMFGDESFETYTASISNKTGYDIDLYDCRYFMQPSLTLSYIYAYTTDYTNSTGLAVTSEALHVFNVNPELKFRAELDDGYNPYISIGYNLNIEKGGEVKAGNVVLPELSVDPFLEFKFGVLREIEDGLSGFIEVSTTTGGREGYAAQAGIKWNF